MRIFNHEYVHLLVSSIFGQRTDSFGGGFEKNNLGPLILMKNAAIPYVTKYEIQMALC